MSFIMKKGVDSYGEDVGHFPNKTVEELKTITNGIYDAVAFNTTGYIKNHAQLSSKEFLPEFKGDLYINEDKIKQIIQEKKDMANGSLKRNITFVITTCKRLDFFIRTMDAFLYNCRDLYIINKWLVIDDQSSEEDRKIMKERYNFFNFIFKTKEEKGHAKSLNIMLKNVKTKYIFMFEDDWECNKPFSILPYIKFLVDYKYDHVAFHSRGDGVVYPKITSIEDKIIYKHLYNSHSKTKENLLPTVLAKCLEFEKEFNTYTEPGEGFHYPGFTLNPSIIDISKVKSYNILFEESSECNESFEMHFAFKCMARGYKTCFSPVSIFHTGNYNSAYVLNDKARSYDKYDNNRSKS